ncbi:MAG: FAD-dependent oxidoreductase [Verrucomicrobiae bacterium]|nr:FAD-dependent oxidoreductase [Verrucomicrobiae bacterium]
MSHPENSVLSSTDVNNMFIAMKKEKMSKAAPVNTYDVIVCGGGSAGVGAAWAAAQQGMSTLLVEQFNFLGGTATASLNFGFVQTIGMNGPAFKNLYQRMQELGGGFSDRDMASFLPNSASFVRLDRAEYGERFD